MGWRDTSHASQGRDAILSLQKGGDMLVRINGDGALLVAQPAHAWLSGQLARAWGNRTFGAVEPFEEVCAGAALHDIGWVLWEMSPSLNPRTGLPHSFVELPVRDRAAIWGQASRLALSFGRYAALLVSLHGTGLYESFGIGPNATELEAGDYAAMVEREYAFQDELLASLRADPDCAAHATPDAVQRNRRLVAAWDGLSLAICEGAAEERLFRAVPAADGALDVALRPDANGYILDPWPMRQDEAIVTFDCKRLDRRHEDEQALRADLERAPVTRVTVKLRPAP
jgi:hypothetical protein